MQIHIIYQDNSLRNYNYLLLCEQTLEAAVIDPLNANTILTLARKLDAKITTIINTHEHHDHVAGNTELVKATGAKIIAHAHAPIANIDRNVIRGDKINVGETINLTVLETPGHTFHHICLLAEKQNPPALFCGDTLFNAGCGNVHNGDVELLYKTFNEQLFKLSDDTQVYPGHDYLLNNLRFAKMREPSNSIIDFWLEKASVQDSHYPIITTIRIEKSFNPFFRLRSEDIIQNLPGLPVDASEHDVFLKLRELRNIYLS